MYATQFSWRRLMGCLYTLHNTILARDAVIRQIEKIYADDKKNLSENRSSLIQHGNQLLMDNLDNIPNQVDIGTILFVRNL